MSRSNFNFVINSVAATAGDLTRAGNGLVLVTGDTVGFLRPKVSSISLKYFIVETLADIDVTVTASLAANTQYRFLISQTQPGSMNEQLPQRLTVDLSFPTVPSSATAGAAFAAAVQGFIDSGQLFATATAITSGNGGVTIAGVANYGLVTVSQPINMTVASGLASGASTSTDFSGVAATGVLTMEVASTSGLLVGQLHEIGWTGNTELINGRTAAQKAIVRVSAILSAPARVQYQAQSLSADFTGDDATYQLLATEASGYGADIIAKRNITGGGDPNVDIVSTSTYHEVVVTGLTPSGSTLTVGDGSPYERHYFINATASASDALLLMTQFSYVEQWLNSGGTAVDPLLL